MLLRYMFPENKVSEVLSKYLFSPLDSLWLSVKDSFYNKKWDALGKDKHSYIGIQNRVFNLVQFDNVTANTIIGCMTDLTSSPHTTAHLTSMDGRMATHIQRHFDVLNRPVVVKHTSPEIAVGDGNGNHKVGVHTKLQALSNVRDIYVLSLNDKIIATRGSTMGYMAAALSDSSKSTPYFINSRPLKTILQYHHNFPTKEYCTRMTSVEPCMHFKRAWGNWKSWFCNIYPYNDSPIKKDIVIAQKDVILCEDFTLGVKIDTRWRYNESTFYFSES